MSQTSSSNQDPGCQLNCYRTLYQLCVYMCVLWMCGCVVCVRVWVWV